MGTLIDVISRPCDDACDRMRVVGIDGVANGPDVVRVTVLDGCERCEGSWVLVPVTVRPSRG